MLSPPGWKVGWPGFRPQRAAPGDFGLLVAPGLGGDRHHAGIGDVDRLAGFQIDGGKQAFDRAGPHIGIAWLGVARHFQEALACFCLGAEISRRQRQAKHPTGGETAFCQTLHHARIRKRNAARAHHLTLQQVRLAGGRLPRGGAAGRKIDRRLMHRPRLAHHGNGAPRQARARPPCRNRRLVGLIEIDAVKPRLRPELAFAGENGLDPTKLGARQRIERMRRLRLLGRACEWRQRQRCHQTHRAQFARRLADPFMPRSPAPACARTGASLTPESSLTSAIYKNSDWREGTREGTTAGADAIGAFRPALTSSRAANRCRNSSGRGWRNPR